MARSRPRRAVRHVTEHGTYNEYNNYGCRCDECREAATAYHKAKKSAGYTRNRCACGAEKTSRSSKCHACFSAEVRAQCGTESGYTAGCRCEACRAASAAGRRERRRANVEATRAYDRARYAARKALAA